MTISVAVADDQALVRAGVLRHHRRHAGPRRGRRGGQRRGGGRGRQVAKPDVLLMDVRMPVLDGIEATRQITSAAASAGVRVIILTTFDLDEYVFGALRAGASGFLLKDTLPEDLITAIRVVAAGEALLAPSVTRRLISEFARTPALGLPAATAPGCRRTRAPRVTGQAARRRRGRAVRRRAGSRWRGSPSCSPTASARCCDLSRPACRTGRSPTTCGSPPRRRRRTSLTCSPSWTRGTASSSSSSPTRLAWHARFRHAPERASLGGSPRRLRASARRCCCPVWPSPSAPDRGSACRPV